MIRVHSIETFGTHEGPGIRLVLFLQGCQFRCLYCHNPDTWGLKGGMQMENDDVLKLLEKQAPYFQGVGGLTISGGEPLVQRKELKHVLKHIKSFGYNIVLDTNGSLFDDDTRELLESVDRVLLDVKHIDPQMHKLITNTSNETTLKFAEYCEEKGIPMWLRYVLVPRLTDQPECLHEWGDRFKDYSAVERVEILPYHTYGTYKYERLNIAYPLKHIEPPTAEQTDKAKKIFNNYFDNVFIR